MSETWRIGVGTTHWESFPFLIILIYSIGCTTLKKENTHTREFLSRPQRQEKCSRCGVCDMLAPQRQSSGQDPLFGSGLRPVLLALLQLTGL